MTDRTLPDGWRWVLFGDVVRQVKETTRNPEGDGLTRVVGLDHIDTASLPVSRWSELSDLPDGTSFTRVFRAGQVLFGKRRAYQRKVAVADFDGLCSGDILVFEPSSDELMPTFLPYVVQSDGFFDHALDTSAGSLSPRTKWQELAKYRFALPPLSAQRAAVDVLSALRHNLEAYQATLEATAVLRASLLEELIAQSPQDLVPLGDLAEVVSGESWSSVDECPMPADDAVPVIGISSLKPEGHIDISAETFVRGLQKKRTLFRTDPLTLLVIRTNGNSDRIGNVYRVSDAFAGRALSAFIFGCRFREVDQQDLAFEYMRGTRFQSWATSLVAGSTGLKNLPIRELRKIPVPTVGSSAALEQLAKLRAVRSFEDAAAQVITTSRGSAAVLREHLIGVPDVR